MENERYGEIGSLLKRARKEKNLSVVETARLMHIRPLYLEALEEGKLSALPGIPYAKGYLQTYAAFLGLDKDEMLRRFEEVERGLEKTGIYWPQAFRREKTPNRAIIWSALAVAALAYILWIIFQPSQAPLSTVDHYAPNPEKLHISAEILQSVACLNPQETLYPPCTMQGQNFDLLPLKPVNSVMELAQPDPDL